MSTASTTTERPSLLRFVSELLFRNWGLKAIAFVLAVIMFVSTRDEVTRGFTVPIKVIEDPERVLLTELPESLQVQAHGPWTRINRLQDYDFGEATLDLQKAEPGPLEIDSASIVMPSGVVLSSIVYDKVDLRFDPIIERDIEIQAIVEGEPAPDYEQVRVEVLPTRWRVRGGASFVRKVSRLTTEVLDIKGADHDVEASRALVPPEEEGVTFVGEGGGEVQVTVRAVIQPKQTNRRVVVSVAVPEALDPTGAVPRTFEVEVRGPQPDFRVLDGLGGAAPIEAQVRRGEGEGKGGGVVEVQFMWADSVPADVRGRLSFDHALERIELPAPPAPPTPLDAPPGPASPE